MTAGVIDAPAPADTAEELGELWRSSRASPFQSPEWLLPWWEVFGSGAPMAIAVRDAGRLAGWAPLYVCDGTVRLIGAGNTDYLDLIALPEAELAAAEAVLQCLAGMRGRWRECDFLDVPAASPLVSVGIPPGLRAERSHTEACPVVPLPPQPALLEAQLAPRLRKGLRQYGRRFGDSGAFRFERAGAESLPEYLDAFFGLHTARWRAGGESGALADPRVREFHRRAAERLQRAGLLRLYGLRDAGGKLRAVLYALVRGRRMYGYLTGHDPELEGFSPGTVMLRSVMEDAIRAGFREFDFLRGREPYKYDWGARDELTWRVRLFPA